MSTNTTFAEVIAVMAAAASGDATARVHVNAAPSSDDLPATLGAALNTLLDAVAARTAAARETSVGLEASRERYRTMFDGNPQPMFVFDPTSLRFIEANDAAAEQYGYTRDELLALTLESIWPHEDVIENRATVAIPISSSRTLQVRHRRKDGTIRDVDLRVHALSGDGGSNRLVLVNDITERLTAETARRAAEARFARLADSGIIGIAVGTLQARVVQVNEALAKIIGYSREEILAPTFEWGRLTPPEWRSTDDAAYAELTASGLAGLREKEYVRKDGSRVPVLVGSAMLEGAAGEIISFVLDLRSNERMESAISRLREALASEATFRSFVEDAPDAIVIVDSEGTIVVVNSQTERHFGYSRLELLGQTVDILVPESRRQLHAKHRAGYATNARPRAMGTSLDLFGLRKDGTEFPVEISLSPLRTERGVLLSAAIRDVSERRQMEELRFRLAAIVESSGDAIVGKTLDGIVTSWNEAAVRLFGYAPEEIIGKQVRLLVPEELSAEEDEILAKLARGERTEQLDTIRRRKDGSTVCVSLTSSPIRDARGRIIGASKIVRDVTERRRAEAALARAKEDAEVANRELEAFSYSVAHDLRAPLRGMHGFAQLLLEEYGSKFDAEAQEWLSEILLNATRMGELIDALLSLARLTRSDVKTERIDLSRIARRALTRYRATDPSRTLDAAIEDGLYADADPRLADAVMDNLVANAWKFTNKVPVARIEFGVVKKEGKRAFFVRDNGAGFDMTFANKLFAPFQRLHTADEYAGTGIGLATVQRIVHRHGGAIWAEGAVNQGATFYFTLGG